MQSTNEHTFHSPKQSKNISSIVECERAVRDRQVPWNPLRWRLLSNEEKEILVCNNNVVENWDLLLVTDPFDPTRIRNCTFYGFVRIGKTDANVRTHHPAGITNSVLLWCDVGDNVAIHNVCHLSHTIVGDECILFDIGEITTTKNATFGNGITRNGDETQRLWIDVANECGGRRILPFDGMISTDAYLWTKYRDDEKFLNGCVHLTDVLKNHYKERYSTIGKNSVIKHTRQLIDVMIDPYSTIDGALLLRNCTVHSSEQEPTILGSGVTVENSIIGAGTTIAYNPIVHKCIVGSNTKILYGARLINTVLGDNSTIACCEVQNNLIFPGHEQHHNNSFLIAAIIEGQSNIAAGATIGSNHNSRANDGEVVARRGFWPALCTSIKHPSFFASYTLLAKGDYPYELNIPFPFSLVNNNIATNELEIMPAYWWLYNMYALMRNTWKYQQRDKRSTKLQHIEYDFLAPDTVQEILTSCRLLENSIAKAYANYKMKNDSVVKKEVKTLLKDGSDELDGITVYCENIENSKRNTKILKATVAYRAYYDMLYYYVVRNMLDYCERHKPSTFTELCKALEGKESGQWLNAGGQPIPLNDIRQLRENIGNGTFKSWDDVHKRYDELWQEYPLKKQQHAFYVWCTLVGTTTPSLQNWRESVERFRKIIQYIEEQVYITRKKDYDNPFRKITYDNQTEMESVLGTPEENQFISKIRTESQEWLHKIELYRELK